MEDPAAEWGFVPFLAAADYPKLQSDAAQRETGGKRSQKTNARRRQQLEKLCASIIKLPLTTSKAASIKTEATKMQVSNGPATNVGPQSDGRKERSSKSSRQTKAKVSIMSETIKDVQTATDITHAGIGQPDCGMSVQDSEVQVGSKKSRKRKAEALQSMKVLAPDKVSQTDGDRPLSRKQQKMKLRQQQYEARKKGRTVDESVSPNTQPLDTLLEPAEKPASHTAAADQVSPGSLKQTSTVHPKAQPAVQTANSSSTLSRKQQKRLERQQRYVAQQTAYPKNAPVATGHSDVASGTADHETPHIDGQVTPMAFSQAVRQPQWSCKPQQEYLEQAQPNAACKSAALQQPKPNQPKPGRASGPKTPKVAELDTARRLPPLRQSQATISGISSSSGLLDRMRAKLQGGRFRWLNEQLYSSTGNSAFDLMQGEPDLYDQYHEGFRRQASDWPQQPVELAIAWLKAKPAALVVADFGCGDAQIAAEAKQKVHSFDLVATVPGVTACNMASTPLEDTSVDVAIFCLALMGTDYGAFLQEAHRLLKSKGWLWICEVRSRFAGQRDPASPGEEPDAQNGSAVASTSWIMLAFTKALQRLGFRLVQRKVINKMFVVFELQKTTPKGEGPAEWPHLKGCVYRKR